MLTAFSKKLAFSLANTLTLRLRFNVSDEKTQILKTYLEVIPPHRILQIVENKQHRLEGLIKKMGGQEGEEGELVVKAEDVHALTKHIKKRINLIPIPLLTKIMQIAVRGQETQHSLELRKVYTKILRTIKTNAEALPLEDLVNFVYKLVKMGKKEYEVMKQVEKVIIQERIKVNYLLIRKILWAYTHTNFGSSVLYAHVSKTLTVGQYEFQPLQLAESAYFLSKVSQNAQGGYGVFSIAEKHVQAHLTRMQFSTLVKSSLFLLTQNLGSNQFQIKLEQALMKTYPDKDKLKINDLVILLKSTSGYFFKYNENALLSKLKTSTIRMSHFATLEQFEDIVWSWGRLGKGDRELWECLEKEVLRHVYQLKPRQLAFIYYSVCSTNLTTDTLLRHIESAFLRLDLNALNQHILIKFLLGMQRKKQYSNSAFQKVSSTLSVKIPELTNNEFMMFLKILNESEIDYTNKNEIGSVISTLSSIGTKLHPKIYTLKITQIAQLAYLWIKLQINDNALIEKCLFHLQSIKDIPKICFIKSMFIFTMRQQYHKSVQFLPILQELLKYGPIGYFFSPYEFPLLAYCVLHLHVQGTNLHINPHLVQQVKSTLKGINPVMLNQFVRKGYEEAMRLMEIQKQDK